MGLFNFGIGGIEVKLEKYEFAPGETIKGHVSLKLKKPIKARKVRIALLGLQENYQLRSGSGPRQSSNYIFNFEKPLDGKKEYLQGEYDFELKIPANILEGPQFGKLGMLTKTVGLFRGQTSNVKWFVEASLDIPMGLDVRKKVQINIG